jgi:hypothetical protein
VVPRPAQTGVQDACDRGDRVVACSCGPRIGILLGVMTQHAPRRPRKLLRRAALAVGSALVSVVALPAIAFADTPASWEKPQDVSGLDYLLVLVLIPAGLALVITLLASLPSMINNRGYEPGQSWRAEPEWFGGPQKGVEAADDLAPEQIEAAESGRGGTSGKW